MSGKKGATTASTSQTPSGSIKDALNPRTRSTEGNTITVEDIIGDKRQEVRSEEDSKLYLFEDSPFHSHGEVFSLSALADTLFHTSRVCKNSSAPVTKTVVSSIRAVAFLLQAAAAAEDRQGSDTISTMTETVDLHLRVATKSFQASLTSAIAKSTQEIVSNVEEFVVQAKDNVKQAFAAEATEAMAKITASTVTFATSCTESAAKVTDSATKYSDVLKAQTSHGAASGFGAPNSSSDPRVKAAQAIKARRILIDLESPEAVTKLKATNDAAIVEKANDAIRDLIGVEDFKFTSVARLRNGGLLLEMNEERGGGWITSAE